MEISKILKCFGLFSTNLENMLQKASRKVKNPMQLQVSVQNKTFIVESAICSNFRENPLGIYDETFSRYVFYILQDGKQAKMNVPLEGNNIPDVFMKGGELSREKEEGGNVITMIIRSIYAYIRHVHLMNTPRPKDDGDGTSEKGKIAYETRFKAGRLKDRTPIEVLLEDENGEEELRTQREFLKKNLSKYPRNKGLIEAIDMSFALLEEGDIDGGAKKAAASSGTGVIKLFSVGLRPLQRKRRADGTCFVYTGRVNWRLGEENPVEIVIENFYAPVEKKENGTLRVIAGKKVQDTYVKAIFNMPASLWLSYIYRIAMDMRLFENASGFMARLLAESAEAYQRLARETEN